MYSFDTPLSPGGLYVNLTTHHGVGEDHLALDHRRTGAALYLHQRWTRTRKPDSAIPDADPTKMAIGIEGGFSVDDDAKYEVVKTHALVVMPSGDRVAYPDSELPTVVSHAADAVLAHAGFHEQEEVAAWQEERRESKYARALVQEPSEGRKISPDPSKWTCEESGARENLWLNLSDGHVGSGRAHWDGSGGNGAALRHYEAMKAEGKEYPLVVKLGTITPSGADVYSYAPDEDDMVEDPLLAEHLSHWGIDVMTMSKTEKSMAELQIDLNKGFEFDKITEAGADLEPAHGPKHVGLKNMGNTCYVASVLQAVKLVPGVAERYFDGAEPIFESAPADPTQDFPSQFAKVCVGLLSDRYAAPPADGSEFNAVAVCPRMFKQLVGKGHAEFATGRQQDAVEYFQHLLEVMTRAERAGKARMGGDAAAPTAAQFEFEFEERVRCEESGGVRYVTRKDNVFSLDVPLDAATNVAEVAEFKEREMKRQKTTDGKEEDPEPVRPIVPFAACLERAAAEEKIEDFFSTALGRKGAATKRTRVRTMPNVLAVQVRRYYVADDWTPKKLDVLVPMPEEINLEHLRGAGMRDDEVALPDEAEKADAADAADSAAPAAAAEVEPDPTIVAQVMSMGFSENASKRAALAVRNASAEHAMEWVFAHMEDADFNDPPAVDTGAAAESTPSVVGADGCADPESVAMLQSMGFGERHAAAALKACGGNLERAADWLFSRADDLDAAVAEAESAADSNPSGGGGADGASTAGPCVDGPGEYELYAVVSHMGANTACGHYVAHVKTDGRWCIFNDRKVAVSAKPPLDLGYLYFYRRKGL